MGVAIRSHRDLKVYQAAFAAQSRVFRLSLLFPAEEKYDAIAQIRRSSRSVCTSIGEAWRKRRYKNNWVSKLADADQEAAETQIWLEIVQDCGYITAEQRDTEWDAYEKIISQLTLMEIHPEKWLTPYKR